MNRRLPAVLTLIALCAPAIARAVPLVLAPPHHDRVVVVVMENRPYDVVRTQPYTASLIASGAELANSYAMTHPSQPNYLALWAGSTLGVIDNTCPAPGSPFAAANLGQACELGGLTWAAYVEDLPSVGWVGCTFNGGLYTRKHAPWTHFSNASHSNEHPYGDLAAVLAANALPNLTFVIPNNCNNSHDCTVEQGDAWLAANVPAILNALGARGMLILTWDEDDGTSGNHILTVLKGPLVQPSAVSFQSVTHYGIGRVICETLGISPIGGGMGVPSITGVWRDLPVDAATASWGGLKLFYR